MFPKIEKIQPEEFTPLETDEEVFDKYVRGLDLTSEDFNKKILDVGGGRAQFARWAKENHISDKIFTIDPYAISATVAEQKSKSVAGRVQDLPFQNESFDLVVSSGAVPMIFGGMEEADEIANAIFVSLKEELRVLKPGGEIRFGPIPAASTAIKRHAILNQELYYVLHELENAGEIEVKMVSRGKRPTMEKSDQWYLFKIKKLR